MKLCLFILFIHFLTHGHSNSDINIGYRVTLAVPMEYSLGFIGRAFIMETDQMAPKFKVALNVEAVEEKYSCSIDVLLGDVRVWSSGHLSRFYATEKCVVELTQGGDLQLKGQKEQVGWRSGTSGQGVQRLNLLRTGNLVLVDDLNMIKWQSFNFPTNIMLWGQRLNVATRLTSFPSNSSNSSFSFEIQNDKIALYLNSGKLKYAYWEFKPPDTGNFKASFQALNSTCDLPLACKPYGICTLSDVCSCMRFITRDGFNSGCSNGSSVGFCSKNQVEMVELQGVTSVLKGTPEKAKYVSKEVCANLCLDDCKCVAALYSKLGDCFLYGIVRGVKQVAWGSGLSYMVKVPKGTSGNHGKSSGLKKWVFVIVGVADGLIIALVLGGTGYYVIQRRKNLGDDNNST